MALLGKRIDGSCLVFYVLCCTGMECRAIVLALEPINLHAARALQNATRVRGELKHVMPFTRENVHILRYRVLNFARVFLCA